LDEVVLVSRFSLGLLFVLAGASKVRRVDEFADAIRQYAVVGDRASRPLAAVIPPVELLLGVALLLGIEPRAAAAGVAGALGVFASVVALNLFRGRRIDCACFGEGASPIGWNTFARNVLLIALSAFVVMNPIDTLILSDLTGSTTTSMSDADGVASLFAASALIVALLCEREIRWHRNRSRESMNTSGARRYPHKHRDSEVRA
jgi:uncharacterized membrane protein YphA (DoxX/SURF4 family)